MQPSGGEPGTWASANTLVAEPRYHNSSPMVQLIGHTNEAAVVVGGVGTTALVDTGTQSLP